MCVLGRSELVTLVNKYRCIHPFNHNLLDGDGYVLTVKEDTSLSYLEHRNLISYEAVFTPPAYVAHLTAKSKYGRMGLSFLNAAKIHSGYVGRLALELVNLNNERKTLIINKGDPFMHIEFVQRTGEPSPYSGEYQFQYLDDDEVRVYTDLLSREFPSLFPREVLMKRASERIRR